MYHFSDDVSIKVKEEDEEPSIKDDVSIKVKEEDEEPSIKDDISLQVKEEEEEEKEPFIRVSDEVCIKVKEEEEEESFRRGTIKEEAELDVLYEAGESYSPEMCEDTSEELTLLKMKEGEEVLQNTPEASGTRLRERSHQNLPRKNRRKPFKCEECGRRYSNSGNVQRHRRIHTGEKPFHCLECGKCFTESAALKFHMRIHKGDKPYHCLECGKSFTCSSNLNTHKRIHTGDKPFKCLECGKSFNTSGYLKTHLKYHAGDKPFQCLECGKSFSTSWNLKKHTSIHTGKKPFSCLKCHKSFSESGNLKRHARIHSEDEIVEPRPSCSWDYAENITNKEEFHPKDKDPSTYCVFESGDKCVVSPPEDPWNEYPTEKKTKKKQHFCKFCKKLKTQITRHLVNFHNDEEEVKNLSSLTATERKKLLARMRGEGDLLYNQRKSDEKIYCRRPKIESQHLPCPTCLQIFKQESFLKHLLRCNPTLSNAQRRELKKGEILRLAHVPQMCEEAKRILVPTIKNKKYRNILFNDPYLIEHANMLSNKYLGKNQDKMICSIMRLIAKIILIMKNLCGTENIGITHTDELFTLDKYKFFQQAMKKIAGMGEKGYKHPSIINQYGQHIKNFTKTIFFLYCNNENQEGIRKIKEWWDAYSTLFISINIDI